MERAAIVSLALIVFGCNSAHAHAFGQRYDLPLPLGLYLLGAGAAVAASFIFLVVFGGAAAAHRRTVFARGVVPSSYVGVLRAFSVALFVIIVAAGLLGNQNPLKNIAPTFVWVLWWVGFSFLTAFVGDLWPIVSPFAIIFEWAQSFSRLILGRTLVIGRPYPAWLASWPAFMLLLLFAWIELLAPGRDTPRVVAMGALSYAAVTWAGCCLFGPRAWMKRGEAFSVFFSLLGRFAPLSVMRGSGQWRWCLRPFAVGLLGKAPLSSSQVAFTLLMLAVVSVDGFFETPPWAALLERVTLTAISPLSQPSAPLWPATLVLCLAPGLFYLTFLVVIRVMILVTPGSPSMAYLTGRFVLTLIPIAIAYHLSHYISFLLLAGQLVIPLVSDPFGLGWDLFGTTLYRINIGIIDARTAWFVAVGAIVTGHVLATWIAHEVAMQVFMNAGAARANQIPMVVLMVGYTVLSLWILAQPIVESR